MQVQERAAAFAESGFALVAVGFSPPAALSDLADHLGWEGPFCSDESRELYRRLDVGRAPVHRVFNLGTLARYGDALRRRERVRRPVEDLRQLGADVLVVEGRARVLARPTSPDDRASADDLLRAAERLAAPTP